MLSRRTTMTDRGAVLRRRTGNGPIAFTTDDMDDDDTQSSADLRSLAPSDQFGSNGDANSQRMTSSWDIERESRMKGFDEIANRQLLPEETELMIRKFERAADVPFSRTYQMGRYVKEFDRPTRTPQIGLVVLPGADLPEVNRLEQAGMVSSSPDQRDAAWRVGTAGGLLSNIIVSPDLNLVTHDVTSSVAYNAAQRYDPTALQRVSSASYSQNAVTIQSENVHVVHDLIGRKDFDLSATLIEVNVSSLWSLLTDYKHIILNSGRGPLMTPEKTTELLDQMIEAARRFCLRSPILFRMSTRLKIINSNNTRYGLDNEHAFQTFTTSKGIQELIMASTSYYSALDPSAPGMDTDSQRKIRPKFLQMLTLLLSLLNNYDLEAMSEFLYRTFGIVPNRPDLELLFLKIMPLTSINSKIFLQGLLPAVDADGWQLPESPEFKFDGPKVWRSLMRRLAARGYLLPGSVEELGHRKGSWIVQWPEEGIHSSTAFSRLQVHGKQSATFNEIPAGRFSYEPDLKELLVHMTNDETYSINPADYEQISTLAKGLYSITRCEDNSICDLEISETLLNGNINEAVEIINDAIRQFNHHARPQQKQKRGIWAIRQRSYDPMIFPDVDPALRLTRNQAMLNGSQILAVAYKLNGRNVPKSEAMRHMSHSLTRVSKLFARMVAAAGRNAYAYYQRHIDQVNRLLASERQARRLEVQQPRISDAPIARAFGPDVVELASLKVWHEYWVYLIPDSETGCGELLGIRAESDVVQSVAWRLPGQQADVTLTKSQKKLVVAPLKPVGKPLQDEEVRVNDLVVLAGRYLIVATVIRNDWHQHCIMTNWLEIQESASTEMRRRGRNYEDEADHPTVYFV